LTLSLTINPWSVSSGAAKGAGKPVRSEGASNEPGSKVLQGKLRVIKPARSQGANEEPAMGQRFSKVPGRQQYKSESQQRARHPVNQ